MGLYINAYGVKLDEVYAILGSKDEALYQCIVASNIFSDMDEPPRYYSVIPISKAIRDLIFGKPDDVKIDAAYVFALICIFMHVKKDLPHCLDIKLGYETDLINTYLAKDFKLRKFDIEVLLANPFRIFPFPDIYTELDPDSYECPAIGLLTQANLRYLKNRFRKIKIHDETVNKLLNSGDPQATVPSEDQDKGHEYQNIKWIIEDIDYCLDNGLEMFTTLG